MSRLLSLAIAPLVFGSLATCGGESMILTSTTAQAAPAARLVPGKALEWPDWPCPTGACSYAFQFQNRGPDCATAVGATVRMFRSDGTLAATDTWKLEPSFVVRPQESVRVVCGPVPYAAVERIGSGKGKRGRAQVAFQIDAVRCANPWALLRAALRRRPFFVVVGK